MRLQKSQQFVCLDSDGGAVDRKPADGRIVETFTIVKSTRFAIVLGVRLTAVNGRYLQVLSRFTFFICCIFSKLDIRI